MRPYKVVDAFSATAFLGNPVAVILDGQGLTSEEMQAIARWTNLSETTFVLPATDPAADYFLRIFTPASELPFAGHPTLGSAHAIVEAGLVAAGKTPLIQQCEVGLIRIDLAGEGADRLYTLTLPPAKMTDLADDDVRELEAILQCPVTRHGVPATVNVGPIWIIAQLTGATAVLDLKPDFPRLATLERKLGATGLTVFGPQASSDYDIEVRSFAPSDGIEEDPVSGNGSVAVYRSRRGAIPTAGANYVARQGRCVGRDGYVMVEIMADGGVKIGGACVTCIDGRLQR